MGKGACGWILPAAPDLDAAFEKVWAGDSEVVQEPAGSPTVSATALSVIRRAAWSVSRSWAEL